MALPLAMYTLMMTLQFMTLIYRLICLRQPRKLACADMGSIAMSSLLTLFYLMVSYFST
jgi:hypothetical protein